MAYRVPPPDDAVADILADGPEISRQLLLAEERRDQWLERCARHDPRPTNRQIARVLGVTEPEIRRRLTALG